MRLSELYGPSAAVQPQDAPISPAQNTNPPPATKKASGMGTQAVSISWIGILIALVLLRVVYEVSD